MTAAALDVKKMRKANPYIAGKALDQERGFVGRDDILELVANEMLSADRNAVVLLGQRRIGKTSILLQLQRRLPPELFLPIYFDLMDHSAVSLGRLLYDLAATMAATAQMPPVDPTFFDDEGNYFRRDFLPSFYAAVGQDIRPVLLFDEFDVLAIGEDRQLSATASARSFFPYVRRLLEREQRLGFVFVAGRKAEELTMDVKAALKTARYKRVSVLDSKSARDLILTAERQGTLSIAPAAVDRIIKLTSGHPYFTQLICQLLWDDLHSRNRVAQEAPRVEVTDVDAVVQRAPEVGENIFEWIWDGLPPAERVIYAAIAQATETRPYVSAAEVIDVLQKHGIRFLTRELELAPETLVKWEMLQESDGKYGFFIELMRRWVVAYKPLPKVKDELDRLVPLADSLYHSGDGFYRRGSLENSQNLLQQALSVNPNHLKARLLLGQVFVEEGRLEDAVRELEEAHRYDESASRYPLVRTLLLRQEELERNTQVDAAIAACERVLELSPGNPIATERWTAMWRERGDKALSGGSLDAAAEAYEKIKAADMLERVAARKKQVQIDNLAAEAQSLSDREQWDEAIEIYKKLIVLDAADKKWKEALERCQTESKFAKLYADALQAINAENWRKAQQHLIEILRARPEYKDTSELLVLALKPLPPPLPSNMPSVGAFLALYVKAAVALGVCLALGLMAMNSGNGSIWSTIGFYLGAAFVLGLVLAALEVGAHWLSRRITLPDVLTTRLL